MTDSLPPELHTPPAKHGRAGRNLPAAIAVGVVLLGGLAVCLIWFQLGFAIFVAAALVQGALEINQALRRIDMNAAIKPIIAGTVVIVVGSYFAGQRDLQDILPSNTVLIGVLGLTILVCLVWRMPGGADGYIRDTAASLFIIAYIPLLGSFVSLMLAGPHGNWQVVTFIAAVSAGDIGGYVAGVLFGKHKMSPRISPKKTWEGFVGTLLFGGAVAGALGVLLLDINVFVGIGLGLALVTVGTCGDLIESLIKRDVGIKDMSSFLPGHGGVMDRLDSLLIAAPVAWLILFFVVG